MKHRILEFLEKNFADNKEKCLVCEKRIISKKCPQNSILGILRIIIIQKSRGKRDKIGLTTAAL